MPEFTANGALHLHGVLIVDNYAWWLNHGLRRLRTFFGNVLLKDIDNPVKWACYCTKDSVEAYETFKGKLRLPMTLETFDDIFTYDKRKFTSFTALTTEEWNELYKVKKTNENNKFYDSNHWIIETPIEYD